MVDHPARQPLLPQPSSCSQGRVPASWGPTCSPISQGEALGTPELGADPDRCCPSLQPQEEAWTRSAASAPRARRFSGELVGTHPPPLVPTGGTQAGKPLTRAACLSQLGSGLTQTPDRGRLHHRPLLYPSLLVSLWGSGPASSTSTSSAAAHIQGMPRAALWGPPGADGLLQLSLGPPSSVRRNLVSPMTAGFWRQETAHVGRSVSTDAWSRGAEWPALRLERWEVPEGRSTVQTGQRLPERREQRGRRLAQDFVKGPSAFQLLQRGEEPAGTRGLWRHPCPDPGGTVAGMGGGGEEAGTAIPSR